MAHLSGYAGSLTLDGASASSPVWADSVGQVTRWRVVYSQKVHDTTVQGATVRGTPGISTVNGLRRWTAHVDFLVPASMPANNQNMTPGGLVTMNFLAEASHGYQGVGVLESFDEDCPLDGPVTAVATIHGVGLLTEQAA